MSDTGQSEPVRSEPESLVLRSGARKWLALLCGSGVFVIGGGWMLADGTWIGLLLVVFFGCGVLLALACVVFRPELRLDALGFTTTFPLVRTRRYEFERCSEFNTWTYEQPIGGSTTLVVFDYPSDSRGGWLHRANARMTGRSEALRDTFGMSANALADALNDRRRHIVR